MHQSTELRRCAVKTSLLQYLPKMTFDNNTTVVRIVSKYGISYPIGTCLKAVQTLVNHWYTIFWETIKLIKGNDIQIPVFDHSSRNYGYNLHMNKDLFQSKQYPMCIFANQNWKKDNINYFINCFKNTWGKTLYVGEMFRVETS